MVTGRVRVRVSCLDVGRRTRTRKGAVEDIRSSNTLKKAERTEGSGDGRERCG